MLHDKCKILLVKHVGCWHPFIILPIFIGLKTKQQIAKTEGKKQLKRKRIARGTLSGIHSIQNRQKFHKKKKEQKKK